MVSAKLRRLAAVTHPRPDSKLVPAREFKLVPACGLLILMDCAASRVTCMLEGKTQWLLLSWLLERLAESQTDEWSNSVTFQVSPEIAKSYIPKATPHLYFPLTPPSSGDKLIYCWEFHIYSHHFPLSDVSESTFRTSFQSLLPIKIIRRKIQSLG